MIEIIPAIDIIEGKCVRLSQGDYHQRSEYKASPVDMAKRYADHGLRRIHVVDLDGAKAKSPANLRLLEQMARIESVAIEWGGGLKNHQALKDVFNAGAAYAIIGSVAATDPELFEQWLGSYGSDKIVLGADARDGRIAVNGWQEATPIALVDILQRFANAGLSQAIVTDIACDGMLKGPNYELYTALQCQLPSLTFTVSGGIGTAAHIERLAQEGLPRVIVGKAIYEGLISLKELQQLANN
ncbi:MAG: 1-(5-phosphoribosyl)-5-[(5-phosphoribosylamino)methylideneamino]imidazole-4-carboxamide isomerase [Bacteroidales bacterium]|nr:1-(5-phosphoribosyl)-5-[(5-phosphoribosylamino)methylideneamino]imidazole-4-carboxamide isomerase [Bacteroidales bacterium]